MFFLPLGTHWGVFIQSSNFLSCKEAVRTYVFGKRIVKKISSARADVLPAFSPDTMLDGKAKRGGVLFKKLCINCHKVKHEGYGLGPRVESTKTKEALLCRLWTLALLWMLTISATPF